MFKYDLITQKYKNKNIMEYGLKYNFDKKLDIDELEELQITNKEMLIDNNTSIDAQKKKLEDKENEYYQKKQEIFRYLPFNLNNINHPKFFYKILPFESEKYGTISNNFYPTLFEFFKKQNITMKNIYLENDIMNFINNNQNLYII